MLPMQGMRVIDISHVIAGPTAGHYLAQQGAEVIKIEQPGRGDVYRAGRRAMLDEGLSVGFAALNAGKKSVTVDLKDASGIEAVRRLAAGADVFIENFRPGVIERLGLGHDAIRAVNPRIVYVSISGYGQEGAWAARVAYDHVVQALTGMMMLQGEEGAPPVKVGFPVIDAAAGMVAAQAVLGALLRRERSGEGSFLDVSMAQAALQLMLSPAVVAALEGRDRPRPGNRGFTGSPGASTFACADGWIATAANTAPQFIALCTVLGAAELLQDAALLDPDALKDDVGFVAARDDAALQRRLEAAFARQRAAELESRLAEAGVPAARVRTLAEFVEGFARGGWMTAPETLVDYPQGRLTDFGPGWRTDRADPAPLTRAPALGEHNDEVLAGPGSPSRSQPR